MKVTFWVFLIVFTLILVGGCINIAKTSGEETSEPAPPWVEEKAQKYLENKLGKDYVEKYIQFKSASYNSWFRRYTAYFDYNHPYNGSKTFELILYQEGYCDKEGKTAPPCNFLGGPNKPHTFGISGGEAIEIARKQGMKKYDGVEFSYSGVSEDYVLDVYTNELEKGEISHVYIDSSTGGILGVVVSSVDYKAGDVVSVEEAALPSINHTKNI